MTGPQQVLHYRLTPADALAWERRPMELTGWRKLGFFAPWVVLGMGWGVAEPLPGLLARSAVAGGAAIAVWLAVRLIVARARRRRALARVPAPLDMMCEVWGDHLEARPVTGAQPPTTIAPEAIRQVLATPDRLFLDAAPALLILPRTAFATPEDMAAFAAHWDALSCAAAD
ncbi:hypothetical protein [Gemmobacter sp.]|uniref:hypothetical protein n=1 Tax=Gemmobacter sp. TaxID=1898957 RepID=UPI002AFF9277|nr:hypothetical protein [Gemmobacter sp.]